MRSRVTRSGRRSGGRAAETEESMDQGQLCRWLDGELSEPEASLFLASLSEAERREALALAAVVGTAAALPVAAPSEGFHARTMARVRARRPPRRSLLTWLRTPSLSPLAALGCALLLAAGSGLAAWRALPRAGGGAPLVVARLACRAPNAREVAVAADFNGWKPETSRMHRGENGVWTLEVPLPAGRRYEYLFVVDGQWKVDPDAAATVDDGFGGSNAVLAL